MCVAQRRIELTDLKNNNTMSFMTIVIFLWILSCILFLIIFHNDYEVFYMIQQEQREEEKQGKQHGDGPTVLAYSAVIAAMMIQQLPQIDV